MTTVLYVNISEAEPALYETLYALASEDRKLRADRCVDRESALRCLVAGSLLRYAVGSDDFAVETDPMGKPCLRGREDFCFNLSHSGDWVVIAYGESPVGVDVETRCWDESAEKIVKRFFAPEEQAFVFQSEDNRRDRFLQIWTAKESYLKYLGTGIRCSLRSFSVLSEDIHPCLSASRLPDGAWITLYAQNPECKFRSIDLEGLTESF